MARWAQDGGSTGRWPIVSPCRIGPGNHLVLLLCLVLRLGLHRKEVSWNPLYCASGAEMVASGARAPSGGVVLPMSSRHTSAWLAGWVRGVPCPAHINTQHPNLHNWCFRHRRHSRICSLSLSLVTKYGDATPPPVAFKNHWWVTIWPH